MTYASEVLADSPLLYWRLGETSGTTAADASGNGRTGTYTGSPTLGVTGLLAGDSDKAATLPGTGGYVTGAAPATTSAFTLEFWFSTAASGTLMLASRYPTTVADRLFTVQANSGGKVALSVRNSAGSNGNLTGLTTVVGNGAHHIVCTYDGSNLRIYVDGVLDNSAAFSGALSNVTPALEIAARTAGPSGGNGTYDEVALYNTALSGTRIAAHYSAATPPPATNVTPTFTAANTQTYTPEIVFGELDVTPGFTAANTQTFPPSVATGAQRNITVTAAVERGRWHAAVIDPDRTAEVQPPRHRAGVTQ